VQAGVQHIKYVAIISMLVVKILPKIVKPIALPIVYFIIVTPFNFGMQVEYT